MRRLAIIGASGHGKVVAEVASASGWESIHFFDDAFPQKKYVGKHRVIGVLKDLMSNIGNYDGSIVAIGSNAIRLRLLRQAQCSKLACPSIIHPSAIISKTVEVGEGVCVMPGVVVNADAIIGDGVILNSMSVIEHDCEVEAGAHISPGARLAGGVSVGEKAWIGIGASVIQDIKIGSEAIVGAGSVVLRDIPNGRVAVGTPAKVIK